MPSPIHFAAGPTDQILSRHDFEEPNNSLHDTDFFAANDSTMRSGWVKFHTILSVVIASGLSPGVAVSKTWAPVNSSTNWHDPANWSPTGIPADDEQVRVDIPFQYIELEIGDTNAINSLYLTNGARLYTGSYMVVVDEPGRGGQLAIEGSSSKVVVQPGSVSGRDVDTDELDIRGGGELELAGGIVHVDLYGTVEPAARITGYGLIQFNDSDANDPPRVLNMDGTIRPIGGEMILRASDDAEIFLGTGTNLASIDAGYGDLTVFATLGEPMQGVVTVGSGRVVNWQDLFVNQDDAVINLFGGTAGQPATFHAEESRIQGRINVNRNGILSGANSLWPDSEVRLPDTDDVLLLQGTNVFFGDAFDNGSPGVVFSGQGVIHNDVDAKAVMVSEPTISVDFVNSGVLETVTLATFVAIDVGVGVFDDFRQTATGQFNFDIGQVSGDLLSDRYEIGGVAALDGELLVELVDLLSQGLPDLEIGDSFEILSAVGGVIGQFSSVNLPDAPAGATWRLQYNANNIELSLVDEIALPGDYNDDGVVDAGDYIVWRDNLGAPEGTLLNDPNTGAIGQAQYNTWKTNFGETLPPPGLLTNATVPEPSGWVLLVLACVLRRPPSLGRIVLST